MSGFAALMLGCPEQDSGETCITGEPSPGDWSQDCGEDFCFNTSLEIALTLTDDHLEATLPLIVDTVEFDLSEADEDCAAAGLDCSCAFADFELPTTVRLDLYPSKCPSKCHPIRTADPCIGQFSRLASATTPHMARRMGHGCNIGSKSTRLV